MSSVYTSRKHKHIYILTKLLKSQLKTLEQDQWRHKEMDFFMTKVSVITDVNPGPAKSNTVAAIFLRSCVT